MSAESPRRSRACGPLIVPPQAPCDRTLMDTVSGFINDVTLTSSPGVDPKDVIQWARFEVADLNEPKSDCDGDSDLQHLLLVIGYGSGIQVWVIQPGGEAQEALSWRHGSVRVLRVLPTPSHGDYYAQKRPMIALCDSTGPGAPYCSLSFISLLGGDQVKSIKFKNPILDVVANKRSVVVSFVERLAVFDACKLEDRLTVTTCYPCPCPLGSSPANPLALGDRWLAYAERRLIPSKRSSGGCEGEGTASYTATVLHAAKSLGKGLRGLGESVASSLGGTRAGVLSQSPSPPNIEQLQPGVVSIIDLENWKLNDEESLRTNDDAASHFNDSTIAHFVAHSEPIVALKFDSSGMVLITADKRGHDFHVFRVHPHPSGPHMASVHHLYVLHRGDTTAKVQDMSISFDCRWVAVSTLRGTTHVFPITPYGGGVGVRTHASPHVVNRLSRFHRSAGLGADGRSNSPVGENLIAAAWYPNPRLPPFPVPCITHPLAQIRPPLASGAVPALPTHTITRNSSGRQRLSSLSEEGQLPLAVCAQWGAVSRVTTGIVGVSRTRGLPSPPATQALYVMSAYGNLIQYHIHPKHASGIPKEKVCDDTPIELEVEAKAQWPLTRPQYSQEIMAPLSSHHILIKHVRLTKGCADKSSIDSEERWLSQVEIMTHAGPHRRLWMGPQFVFKTYNVASGTSLSLLDFDAVEVGTGSTVARSNPVNMPGARPMVPVLIESGSASSLEHSPRLSDAYKRNRDAFLCSKEGENDGHKEGEVRLKEDLAEAMRETDQGCEWTVGTGSWNKEEECRAPHVHRIVNPLGTVVSGASSSSPSPPSEGDSYILSNEDEALFRPVVRAPRSLPVPTAPPTRPLSSRTLLPAQHVSVSTENCSISPVPAASLTDNVVIPAKLSQQQLNLISSSVIVDNTQLKQNIVQDEVCDKKMYERSSYEKCVDLTVDCKKMSKEKILGIKSSKHQKISLDYSKKCKDENKFIMNPLVTKVSKASDEIQFCNSEVVENFKIEQSTHITPYQFENISNDTDKKYNINVVNIHDCENDSVLLKNVEIESHDLEETLYNITKLNSDSETVEIIESNDLGNYQSSLKKRHNSALMKDNSVSVKSDWEILPKESKDIKHAKVECEDVNSKNVFNVVKDDILDDMKPKLKKNKKNKLKPKSVIVEKSDVSKKSELSKSEIIKNNQEIIMTLPVTSISWSEITSPKVVNDSCFSSTESILPIKESKIYNQSNIVVAVCDSPQTDELYFVDEHHSIFLEPPPLEPIDLFFDDKKDFEGQKNSCFSSENIQSINDLHKSDASINILDSINDVNEISKINNNDRELENNEKKVAVEKSSDEENVSSQGDSDDGTQMILLEENCTATIDKNQDNDSSLVSFNMSPVNKTNKKKSKRKRR